MDKIFRLNNKRWEIDPSIKIIKKDLLGVYCDANEIVDKSKELALDIETKANEDYQKRFNEGYEKGCEEGKGEYALKIMETVLSSVDSLEGLEKQVVEVVTSSIEKIIGSFNADDLIVRVVRKSLSAVRGEKRILVRVSLQNEKIIRNDLRAFLLSDDGRSGYIEVLGDSNLGEGDCILETQLGVIEASLSSQLKILRESLNKRVQKDY